VLILDNTLRKKPSTFETINCTILKMYLMHDDVKVYELDLKDNVYVFSIKYDKEFYSDFLYTIIYTDKTAEYKGVSYNVKKTYRMAANEKNKPLIKELRIIAENT